MQIEGRTPLGSALVSLRGDVSGSYWPVIGGQRPSDITCQQSNEFLLGSILQMQMNAATAWANASRYVGILGSPVNIWDAIRQLPDWENDPHLATVHRYPGARMRVYRTAERMIEWDDDARRLWSDPNDPNLALSNLLKLEAGPQISRMIIGALFDVGVLNGAGSIKADVHTRRVLGRLTRSKSDIGAEEAERVASELVRGPSWVLDATLFRIGRTTCRPRSPRCERCVLQELCAYRQAFSG